MTDSPIKLRADVSPTCRGSTGTRHNGWNPAPLVPPSRIAFESAAFEIDSSRLDNHGWNLEWSESPTSIRTCGVAHATHRCFLSRSRPPRPRWRFRHRSSRGFRRASHTFLSFRRRAVGRLWRRFRFGLRQLGVLAAPAAGSRRSIRFSPLPGRSAGSGSHVRSGPQGRLAPLGRSFADASGLSALGRARLVLLGCRGRGASHQAGRQFVGRFVGSSPGGFPRVHPASDRRGKAHRRTHRLCPLRSGLHSAVRGARRGSFRTPVIFQFSPIGGISP
jgi:hypothetical protein